MSKTATKNRAFVSVQSFCAFYIIPHYTQMSFAKTKKNSINQVNIPLKSLLINTEQLVGKECTCTCTLSPSHC